MKGSMKAWAVAALVVACDSPTRSSILRGGSISGDAASTGGRGSGGHATSNGTGGRANARGSGGGGTGSVAASGGGSNGGAGGRYSDGGAARDASPGGGGAPSSGGAGGSGGISTGSDGAGPTVCASNQYKIVGDYFSICHACSSAPVCGGTSCNLVNGMRVGSSAGTGIVKYDLATHSYDPAKRILKLAPAAGLPWPSNWSLTMNNPQLQADGGFCNAHARTWVDEYGFLMADLSEFNACTLPSSELVFDEVHVGFGCAGAAYGSLYVAVEFAGANWAPYLECYSGEQSPCSL